jgi:hypothetical protein
MSIDVFAEEVLTLSKAARRLPRLRDKPPSPATMWRWINKGVKSLNGTTVRLEIVKVGGTTCTSLEALNRFFRRLSEVPKSDEISDTQRAAGRFENSDVSSELHRRSRTLLRQLFDAGVLISKRPYCHLKLPSSTIFNLYLRAHDRMPDGVPGDQSYAVETFRESIFVAALDVLKRESTTQDGWKAAVAWIDGLDLLNCHRQVGCKFNERIVAQWDKVLLDSAYRAKLKAMQADAQHHFAISDSHFVR